MQTIADDAVRAGRGARLELTLDGSSDEELARMRRRLAWLGERGVLVTVRRDAAPVRATVSIDEGSVARAG